MDYNCICGKNYKCNSSLWEHKKTCNIYIENFNNILEGFEDMKGYEGLYKINRNGEIWSCYYQKKMKHLLNDDGYYYVSLKDKNKKRHKCLISRLLGFQYIPNDDIVNNIEIDHINRIKTDNRIENLRWVSRNKNLQNKNRNGCVYQDIRKNGKIYWKSNYSWWDNGVRIFKQKTSVDRDVCIKWLENIKQEKQSI